MRNWRSNRSIFLIAMLGLAFGLIAVSQSGLLGGIPDIVAAPIRFVSSVLSRAAFAVNHSANDFSELETLRQRNAELEEALVRFQSELVDLREIASDYTRLSDLLGYVSAVQDQEFLTANIIASDDPNALLRTIVIDRGARDGVAEGMPVVTRQGIVGRIYRVAANASQVLLISDPSSAISARLQSTRVEGSVIGSLSGDLTMTFIQLDSPVKEGELVITSGLGGNLPEGIVIGQVTSVSKLQFELYQEATLRSLNNFDTLEIVLVVTNFKPVDLSVFQDTTTP